MERLTTLKELFDNHFLSLDEYNARKTQIIDEITKTSLQANNNILPSVEINSKEKQDEEKMQVSDSGDSLPTQENKSASVMPMVLEKQTPSKWDLHDKYSLSRKIGKLPTTSLRSVLQIVKQNSPASLRMSGDDWTFDLDELEDATLAQLHDYVHQKIALMGNEENKEEGSVGEEKRILGVSVYTEGEEPTNRFQDNPPQGSTLQTRGMKRPREEFMSLPIIDSNQETTTTTTTGERKTKRARLRALKLSSSSDGGDNQEEDGDYVPPEESSSDCDSEFLLDVPFDPEDLSLADPLPSAPASLFVPPPGAPSLPSSHAIDAHNAVLNGRNSVLTTSTDGLNNSMNRPEGEKKYKIQVCIYTLAKQQAGARPYVCNGCDKSFKDKSNLTQHLRVHTKERPYACTFKNCRKRFAHSTSLKEHINVHLGNKPFQCPHCPKGFTQQSNWRRHLRVHTGEKPYTCTYCKKPFSQNSNLKQHIKRHHPNA